MSEDLYSLWIDTVKRVAHFTCRDFPDVEKEELIQELLLFVVENSARLKNPDMVGAFKALTTAAKVYAWDQRKQHLQLTSQYSYRTSDVKNILHSVFDHDDWSQVRVPDDARSEYNDVFMEINCDVKVAWQSLGHAHQKIIFEKYALGIDPDTPAERQRFYRAICQLTDNLNWYKKPRGHEFVGNRRVITNANARYNISKLNDGE